MKRKNHIRTTEALTEPNAPDRQKKETEEKRRYYESIAEGNALIDLERQARDLYRRRG